MYGGIISMPSHKWKIVNTEDVLFDLSSDQFDRCTNELFYYIFHNLEVHTIIRMIVSYIIARPEKIELVFSLFKYLLKVTQKKNKSEFINIWLSETKLKSSKYREISYFSYLINSEKIVQEEFPTSYRDQKTAFINGVSTEISIEMHHFYISKGVTPDVFLDSIRKDDLSSLIQHINANNIDVGTYVIEPNTYERCTPIANNRCSLIEAAAFFGSQMCFKYLLMINHMECKPDAIMEYAIMGGSVDIIHFIEEHFINIFKYLEKISLKLIGLGIKYHHVEIVDWLLEKYKPNNEDLAKLTKKSITWCSYNMFYYRFRRHLTFRMLKKIASKNIYDTVATNYLISNQKKRWTDDEIMHRHRSQLVAIVLSAIESRNFPYVQMLFDKMPSLCSLLEVQFVDIILKCIKADDSGREIARYLLNSGRFDLNKERSVRRSFGLKSNGTKPLLLFACDENSKYLVNELLNHQNLDVNVKCIDADFVIKNALDSCCENCSNEILNLFINKTKTKVSVNLPLHFACRGNKLDNFKTIYSALSVDINKEDSQKRTCLHYACEKDQEDFVDYILSLKDLDLKKTNVKGYTPFLTALATSSNKSATLLLKSGLIDVNQEDAIDGSTPLHIACNTNNIELLRCLLMYKGIDINKENHHICIIIDSWNFYSLPFMIRRYY